MTSCPLAVSPVQTRPLPFVIDHWMRVEEFVFQVFEVVVIEVKASFECTIRHPSLGVAVGRESGQECHRRSWLTLRSLSCASLVALQCHTFARKGRVGCDATVARQDGQDGHKGRGGLWGVGNGMREAVCHRPHRAGRLHVVPVTHAHSGDSGVCGQGKGPRSRRSGLQDGRRADAEAATPFPAEPRAGPGYARLPPTTADGTAWLYRRRRRAYTNQWC